MRLLSMYTFHWVTSVASISLFICGIVFVEIKGSNPEIGNFIGSYLNAVLEPLAGAIAVFIVAHLLLMIRDCFRMEKLDTRYSWIFIMLFFGPLGSGIFFLRNRGRLKETFLY